jgi:tRNA uridine 5-carbamoylmethylation protein Kti12
MKKLVILAGLPGVGKSYTARILEKKIKNSFYFDSDLFSKNYIETNEINFMELSDKQKLSFRKQIHLKKMISVLKTFENRKIVFLDTCFDIPSSRLEFHKLVPKISLIIVKILAKDDTVKKRILQNEHDPRIIGNKQTRWNTYLNMKKNWRKIEKIDFHLDSDKYYPDQIKNLITYIEKYK